MIHFIIDIFIGLCNITVRITLRLYLMLNQTVKYYYASFTDEAAKLQGTSAIGSMSFLTIVSDNITYSTV